MTNNFVEFLAWFVAGLVLGWALNKLYHWWKDD